MGVRGELVEDFEVAIWKALANTKNYPEPVQPYIIGRDISVLVDRWWIPC